MLIMPFIERLSQSLPTMRSQWLFQSIYTIDINNSRAGRVYENEIWGSITSTMLSSTMHLVLSCNLSVE